MNKSLMTLYPLTEIYTQPFILQAMLPLPLVKKFLFSSSYKYGRKRRWQLGFWLPYALADQLTIRQVSDQEG
jgi:hypothetical protein